MHGQVGLVGKLLQTPLPESVVTAIAGAAVTEQEYVRSVRVYLLAQGIPPGGQGGDGELGCVMVYPDVHEALFLQDVIDTVGYGFEYSAFLLRIFLPEVIHIDLGFLSWWEPLLAAILPVANLLGLLGINGENGQSLNLHL